MAREVIATDKVRLIITDSFDQVVGEFAVRAKDRLNEDQGAGTYASAKVDGARATAKTIPMDNGQIVVVASDSLLRSGSGRSSARRVLLHEAQHVRLEQQGDAAFAVHRRGHLDKPDEFAWEFVWLAESFMDEFRCERTLQQRGLHDPSIGVVPEDYPKIVEHLRVTHEQFWRHRDLSKTYHAMFAAFDRLTGFLAYAAALLVANGESSREWEGVAPLRDLVPLSRDVAGSEVRIDLEELLRVALIVAGALRQILNSFGFDLRLLSEGGIYLEVFD
jgi:hypothetical protein